MSVAFRWVRFDALTGREMHDLLRLRQDVFVVEQACAFPEIDGRDAEAEHLLALRETALVGCLRLFTGAEMRIGRIATAASARGTGLGHRLMEAALRRCAELRPAHPVVLSAQSHLQDFYAAHGFKPSSATYLEDGILHVDMRRTP